MEAAGSSPVTARPTHALESLGLFARPSWLPAPDCARLVEAMHQAARIKGTIANDAEVRHLDERVRKVWCADVGRGAAAAMHDALSRLKPELESHFERRLADLEGPDFLIYEPGAFYTPHRDTGPHYQRRCTSVVLFLNAPGRDAPDAGGYTGGELTFHGLLDGAAWAHCPVRVTAAPGLLVAFPSTTLHEVRPVSAGRRCSIVGWFSAAP